MYSQLLFFIIALLLFSIQQPGTQPFAPPLPTLALAAGAFLLFTLITRAAFLRIRRAMEEGASESTVSHGYHRLHTQLSILALGVLGVYVYVLNIKFYFGKVLPGFDASLTLTGIVGLLLYLSHLGVIWTHAYPVYQRLYHSSVSRGAFIKGQFAFNSAILIPWILISFVSDLLQFIQMPAFMSTNVGQILLMGVVLTVFILFAPWLVVRLWGCKPLPPSSVRTELERFCAEHHFRVGQLMLWPLFGGEMLTAGVMGILPGWRYILITRGLLLLLDTEELKAVVAHEMGHVRRYHLLFYLFFFLCYSYIVYSLNDILLLLLLRYGPVLEWAITPGAFNVTLFSLLYSVPLLLLLILYFRFIFGFFLRNSERQADLYALKLVGHPFTLVSSFRKIAYHSGQIENLPSWHHYSIRERIAFLGAAFENRGLLRGHDRKLYGAAAAFTLVIALLGTFITHLEGTEPVKLWRAELQLNILEQQLKRSPQNPALLAAYGGLLLEAGQIDRAEAALREALNLAPEDPTILNNLAWLYATAPAPYFNPEKALELASIAASLSQEPHVLDTLAEAYYINARYEEALDAIEKALAANPKNRDYFLKQKERFEEALLRDPEQSGEVSLIAPPVQI